MAKKKAKKNKTVKIVGISLATIVGASLVMGGLYHFVPQIKSTVDNTFGITNSTTTQKEFTTSYELIGEVIGSNEMVVRGYFGEASEFALPKTVSLGDYVSHRYNFASFEEIQQYCDSVEQRYTQASDWDGDFAKERFNYSFLTADDTLYTAKSIEQLNTVKDNLSMIEEEDLKATYPIRHDGEIQSYKAGTDINIIRVESMTDNVKAIKIPAGVDLEYKELASAGIYLYFDNAHETYGTWTSRDGCLIDTNTQTLKYVYPDTIIDNAFTTPKGIKSVDFSAFEYYKDSIKTINIAEGVIAVSGTLDAFDTNHKIVINMPKSLEVINTENLVRQQNARDNVVVYLNSIATYPTGSGIEAYRFARSGNENPTYVLTNELYDKLVQELPEFKDSPYAEHLVSYSIYISR